MRELSSESSFFALEAVYSGAIEAIFSKALGAIAVAVCAEALEAAAAAIYAGALKAAAAAVAAAVACVTRLYLGLLRPLGMLMELNLRFLR